jgi:predicted ATP-binding protein involved in virulence
MNNQFLKSVQVENYFSIKKLELDRLDKYQEIYFLGENGDGKTLILQAILLALTKGKFTDSNASYRIDKEEIAKIEQYLANNETFKSLGKITNYDFLLKGDNYYKNIYAYGANRNKSTADSGGKDGYGKEGYLTLFDNNRALMSPTQWLKDLKLEGRKATINVDNAIKLLEEILDNDVKIKIEGSKVLFFEKDTKLEFEQLSDGFKSVMTWVSDLLARLAENQPKTNTIQDFEGIVLVDEINLHLHPKWERNLVKKLRTWFPKIQFFFTTHSPTMLLSASKDAVFYKVYKENGHTNISEPMPCEKFAGMMANNLITSPLFDLDNAFMEISQNETTNLDTSENYLESKIRNILNKEKETRAKNGKKYMSESDLDLLLNGAFEKYKNGAL